MPSIGALGEHALIERLRRRVGKHPPWVVVGIGDDAAVLEPARGALDVVTTDSLIEDVHFRRTWTGARAIGHKAVAVNLSDLAAMGATPRAVLLNLALPADLSVADFDALLDGVTSAADAAGAGLVGGNLSRSPGPLIVDVTAIGSAHRRRLLTRAGGRPGHELYLTGTVGAAAAGLAILAESADRDTLDPMAVECVDRYERPEARLRCGSVVARSRAAAACIDLSDGLADAASQLAHASTTGVILDADAIPLHDGARRHATNAGKDPLSFGLGGGEDYELLFAVAPRRRNAFLGATRRCRGLRITQVGRLTAEAGAWLDRGGALQPLGAGYQHFRAG